MVESTLAEIEKQESITIPWLDIQGKENLDQFFKLLLADTPKLKFSVINNKGKELYSSNLNVEMR